MPVVPCRVYQLYLLSMGDAPKTKHRRHHVSQSGQQPFLLGFKEETGMIWVAWGILSGTGRLNVYRGNPRQGYYFLSKFSFKKVSTRIKGYEDQDFCLVGALKRAVWIVLNMRCFNFFLEVFFGAEVFLWYVHVDHRRLAL